MNPDTALDQALRAWRCSTMLMRIIVVNAGVFVFLRLVGIVLMLMDSQVDIDYALQLVEVPSSLPLLLERPWTLLTYMFSQYDVMHVLFNMLWLYWFGVVFLQCCSPRQLLRLYLVGGVVGAALFIVSYHLLPVFHGGTGYLIGSSAGVIAIVAASGMMMPDFRFNLLLIGQVSLKWLAIITIGLDLIGVTGINAGGHVAHLGGAMAGLWFGYRIRKGHNPLNFKLDWHKIKAFGSKMKPKGVKTPSQDSRLRKSDQELLDAILDKIKHSGYTSLTPAERRRLFDVSRRIK